MRSVRLSVLGLLLNATLSSSVAVAAQAQRLEVISAGAFADLPMQGALAGAVKNLVEDYGVAVAFGTAKTPLLPNRSVPRKTG